MSGDERDVARVEQVVTPRSPGGHPVVTPHSAAGKQEQTEFSWDRAALAAAIDRWGLAGAARRMWMLADAQMGAEALRRRRIDAWEQVIVEGQAGIRILASERKLGRLLGCSKTAAHKALGRLESLGLASRGQHASGTHVVLWIGRLFDSPEMVSAPLRPPEKTIVSMGGHPVVTPRALSLKENENQIFALSLSLKGAIDDERALERNSRAEFWTAKGLPWQRVTDGDLQAAIAGDTDILRVLYREAAKLRWLEPEQAREFLAVCHHAATARLAHEYRGRTAENPAVGLVKSRLMNRHFRNLSEESYRFADVLLRRMQPTPEAIRQLALSSLREVE